MPNQCQVLPKVQHNHNAQQEQHHARYRVRSNFLLMQSMQQLKIHTKSS